MKAMLLAAGRGSRLRPLTDSVPKPLIPVGGDTLIGHQLTRLATAGFDDVVINLGWLGEQLREALGDGDRYRVRIRYSDEGWPALETGGGILRALPLLGEAPFLLLNADVWGELPLAAMRDRGLRGDERGCLTLVDNPPHKADGDFALIDDRVRNPPAPAGAVSLTFAGASVLHPALFDGAEAGAFALAPRLRVAADAGQLAGFHHRGAWVDVGTPERLDALRASLRAN